jgi:hypothetical protein
LTLTFDTLLGDFFGLFLTLAAVAELLFCSPRFRFVGVCVASESM